MVGKDGGKAKPLKAAKKGKQELDEVRSALDFGCLFGLCETPIYAETRIRFAFWSVTP
jgi:hypothetical protein